MIALDIQFDDAPVRETLAALLARCADAEGLHTAMAMAVDDQVREHIKNTKQSPNTDWWGEVSESVTHEAFRDHAMVAVTHVGAALRYYGGVVTQKPGGPLLAIPSRWVPVANKTRLAPRDPQLAPLAFVAAGKSAPSETVGYLVEGVEKTGKDGKKRVEPMLSPGGRLMFTLRTETTHRPDASVLPTLSEMTMAAKLAAEDFIKASDWNDLT